MGMPAPLYYTRDMLRDLPEDGNRYELVRGELLVTPAPRKRHQLLLGRLFEAISAYLRVQPVAHPFLAPADLDWGQTDTLVQPDLFVVPIEDARNLEWEEMRRLLLVVEVVSPSSSRSDRFAKRMEYQRQGVPLYWIIDPINRSAEVWTPEARLPLLERERLVWQPVGATAPFTLELAELFRPI